MSALLALLWVWPHLPMLKQRIAAALVAARAAVPTATPASNPAIAAPRGGLQATPAPAPGLRFIYEMVANERPLDYLKLARTQWRHEHLADREPYIEVGIWLRYAGLYPLDVARELVGGVGYAGRTFNLAPQAEGTQAEGAPALHLERGDEAVLLIRQRLFDFEAATLRTALTTGSEVDLTTDALRISAHAVTPPEALPALVGHFEIGPRVSNRDPEERTATF